MAVSNFTLAVDRRFKKDGEQTADFIQCVAFGKLGEHVEKYYRKGLKVAITTRKVGRLIRQKLLPMNWNLPRARLHRRKQETTRMKTQASSHTAMDLNRLEMMRVFLSPERSLLGGTDKP